MSWNNSICILFGVLALGMTAACGGDNGSSGATSPAATSPTPSVTDDIDERINAILADGGPSFGEFNREELRNMMTIENDGPFYMVNFINFRAFAKYADGHDATLTGREANARYNALPIILEIGGRPVFVAEVEQQLIGDEPTWDQIAVVLYPSREAFVSMLERADFQELSVHKDAGVEESTVLVTEMRDLPAIPPLDAASLPYPPSSEDTAFTMVHLVHFKETVASTDGRGASLSGREAIAKYEQSVALSALPLGIRPTAVLEVESVLIGDGRIWEEVRLNRFPSHAAFRALTMDPTWQSHQSDRAAALADTYALITLPIIDSIGAP